MSPRASARPSSAAGEAGQQATAAAAAAAAGAPSTSATPEPPSVAPLDIFAAEKLRWVLAVPPEQRWPTMQAVIDSCECTTEATELLAAAPLAQLSGPTKLRAALLLLRSQWSIGGLSPVVTGVSLLRNPDEHPELQPLYGAAATAAYAVMLSGLSISNIQAASLANSSIPELANSMDAMSAQREDKPPVSLEDTAATLEGILLNIGELRGALQQQLAGPLGGGLLTARQLECELHFLLGTVHMWAATPDGAYCGGRVDAQHAAAARAAFSAALRLSDSSARSSGLLCMFANLLLRTGAVAEAEAALQRAVADARTTGDDFLELHAATGLASAMPLSDRWLYRDLEALVTAAQRCLNNCKPWLPNAVWIHYRERVRKSEKLLAQVRLALPATYASQPLPGQPPNLQPGSFVPDRLRKKVGACSGCGGQSVELKFCARCRSAQYCSRACQAKHWRAGHKAECAQLAERTGR